jgi:hypothetical protein
MANSKHLEEQYRIHNWWKANREKIKLRIIESFNLEETFKI